MHDIIIRGGLLYDGTGTEPVMADIAIDVKNDQYGKFWGSFPFDVINLDFWGDIFKATQGDIGVNDFYSIQSIISQQARLRRPYELWITMRVKAGRTEGNVKQVFRNIIQHNSKEISSFKKKFEETFNNIGNYI